MELNDRQGRVYRKLRVSVTDRCQLRCQYCMPEGPAGGAWMPKHNLLSYEQIAAFAAIVAAAGVREVRITGGEPLVRRDVEQLVAMLKGIAGIERVALTTNALRLPESLPALAAAGLDGVTVSLDTLERQRFVELMQRDALAPTLAGIEALAASPIADRKLNAVVLRGSNDDEVPQLIRFAAERGIEARFIEFMPFGTRWDRSAVVPMAEIVAGVAAALGPVHELDVPYGSTARRFAVGDATFGIIPTVSQPLCGECDRLRLTADGRVLHCLFDRHGASVREALRDDDAAAVRTVVLGHLRAKGIGYLAEQARSGRARHHHMHQVGG